MESSAKDKWIFIVNPIAGNGFGETMIPIIHDKISRYGINGEIVMTERSGHAVELSREYCEKGYGFIVGVGGDGTANEVARPLVNRKDVVFGVIPAGTGNDFIQITGFHDRMTGNDWEVFFKRKVIAMDAGSVNGMIFINGMGLDNGRQPNQRDTACCDDGIGRRWLGGRRRPGEPNGRDPALGWARLVRS